MSGEDEGERLFEYPLLTEFCQRVGVCLPHWPAMDTPPDNPDGTPGWAHPRDEEEENDDDDDDHWLPASEDLFPNLDAEMATHDVSGESRDSDGKWTCGGTDSPASDLHATATAWLAGSELPLELKRKYHADTVTVLHKMPAGCRKAALEAIAEPGGGMVFHPDVLAVTTTLETATGKREKARIGGFVEHHHNGSAARVHLNGGSETDSRNPEKAQGVYAHELGHAVDVGRRYSEDPQWESAWKREIFNGKTLLSRYARKSPTEGFAELHRALCEKGIEATAKVFPKCCAFLQAKGLL